MGPEQDEYPKIHDKLYNSSSTTGSLVLITPLLPSLFSFPYFPSLFRCPKFNSQVFFSNLQSSGIFAMNNH